MGNVKRLFLLQGARQGLRVGRGPKYHKASKVHQGHEDSVAFPRKLRALSVLYFLCDIVDCGSRQADWLNSLNCIERQAWGPIKAGQAHPYDYVRAKLSLG
jgi:hypothetical protein